MTQGEALAVVDRDWESATWGSLVLVPVFVVVAFLVRDDVAATLGTGEIVAVVVLSGVLSTGTVAVSAWRARSRGPVTFYPDHLAVDGKTVGYDAVAVAIHVDADVSEDAVGDAGTGAFELFVPGRDVVRFQHVAEPDAVREILAERIPTPADRLAADAAPTDGGGGAEHIDTPRRFWDYWRVNRSLPETAVVTEATMKDALDVDAYNLDLLDGVNVSGVDGLGDLTQSDLTTDKHRRHRHRH